jgi:cytochrome c oxidase subunit 3
MALTIMLGVLFFRCRPANTATLYSELNLKPRRASSGSTFFMLTGFHGFHVTLGVTMLTVILFRCVAGHFKPDHHFGFEAVSWYWHFVDVVWLLLFIFVYWV